MNTLGKNALFSLVHRLGDVLFPLISGMYLARVLAPAGMGQVAAARNLMSYFLLLASLGIPRYAVREVARRQADLRAQEKLVSELLVIHLAAGLVSLGAYSLFVSACLEEPGQLNRIFSLELLFQLINVQWLLEGREDYRYLALGSLGVRAVSLAALVLLVRDGEDVSRYALVLCLSVGAQHLVNLRKARIKVTFRGLRPWIHLRPVTVLMLSGLAAGLYSKVDITMLELLAGQEAVGLYSAAYKVICLVLTVAVAASSVYFPRLSRSGAADFRRYLSGALALVLTLTMPAALGLALVAEDLTAVLFGRGFLAAAPAVAVMAPMILIRGCGDLLCYQAIISAGEEKHLIGARLWAGAANIGLNALLIPRLGPVGAALATLVSETAVNGLLLPRALKLGKPELRGSFLLRILAAAAAMTAAVISVQQLLAGGLLRLTVSVLLGAGVYGCCLGGRKWITYLEEYHGTE